MMTSASSPEKGQTPGAPGERQLRNGWGAPSALTALHRKRRADVCARIDEKPSARCPDRIGRVLLHEQDRRPAADWDLEYLRLAIPVGAATASHCPSGDQAGAPRTSSSSAIRRVPVPSAFITYSSVSPRLCTTNARRPSGAMAGPATTRPLTPFHSSVGCPPAVSFQRPSLPAFGAR